MVQIIRSRATQKQIAEMLESLETYIKLAVDVERELLAGGGVMHGDSAIRSRVAEITRNLLAGL